jgi:hypothetical protein
MISQHDLDAFVERSRIAAIGEKKLKVATLAKEEAAL